MPTTLQSPQDITPKMIAAAPLRTVEVAPPGESTFALWFTRFMYVPAIGGNFVPLIQAVRIIVNGSSENVSAIAWGFAWFCLACWLTYGFVKRDKVLIWANIVGVTNAAILIACIVIYS